VCTEHKIQPGGCARNANCGNHAVAVYFRPQIKVQVTWFVCIPTYECHNNNDQLWNNKNDMMWRTITAIILMVVTCMICVMYSDRLAEHVTAGVSTRDSNIENLPSVMGTENMNYKKTEHDKQCTYNVITRHTHAAVVAVEKK